MSFVDIIAIVSFVAIGYLCGSLPSGLMVSRYLGLPDPRQSGSGNIGATNMLRTSGKRAAVITLAFDALKGMIPALLAVLFDFHGPLTYFAGVAAVLGHMFPVWLSFKGGKGVATSFGVLLIWNPLVAVMTLFCWVIVAFLSRISALAAVVAVSHAPLYALVWGDSRLALFCLIVGGGIMLKHHSNIRRLLNGEENVFRSEVP